MNDTLTVLDGRGTLRMVRDLPQSPDKVWLMLVHGSGLSAWYPAKVRYFEPRLGGKIVFDYGGGTASEAYITAYAQASHFAFTETPPETMPREQTGELDFVLQPTPDGCTLVFSHSFDDLPAAAAYAAGWSVCLDALESALAGKRAPITDLGPMIGRHESYFRAFGLGRAETVRTEAGWTTTVHRQLMRQSPDRAWRALTGDNSLAIGDAPPAQSVIAGITPGKIAEVSAPDRLAFDWLEDGHVAGRITWEITFGPGGARFELTQTGPDGTDPMEGAWQRHVEALAAAVIALPV